MALSDEFLDHQACLASVTLLVRERLEQTKVWVDRQGEVIPLDQIDGRYARNIISFLMKRAPGLHRGAVAETMFWSEPQGEMARIFMEEEQDAVWEYTPQEWMEQQPLIRALRKKIEDSIVAPDRTGFAALA